METIDHLKAGKHTRIHFTVVLVTFLLVFSSTCLRAQVSINTTGTIPNVSAMLDISATGKGLLIPRMTFAELPFSPATGLIIYVTDFNPGFHYYDGTSWQRIGLTMNDYWLPNGLDIFYTQGRIAVGTSNPEYHGILSRNSVNGKSAVKGVDGTGSNSYAEGMLGVHNSPGILTLPVYMAHIGVLGIKPVSGSYGAAVYGWNNDNNFSNYAGLFASDGNASDPGSANYGVYGEAKNAFNNYGGKFLTDYSTPGINYGVHAQADNGDQNFGVAGIGEYGNTNYGLYGYTNVIEPNGNTNYGVWSYASKATHNYAIYSQATNGIENFGLYSYSNYGNSNYAGYFTGRVSVRGNSTNEAADFKSTVLSALVMHSELTDTRAIEGISTPADGWGVGLYGEGGFIGVKGIGSCGGDAGWGYGLYGEATGSFVSASGPRVGTYGLARGSGVNYGIQGAAYGGTENWAGFFEGSTYVSSDLRIGTTTSATGDALTVNGNISCNGSAYISSNLRIGTTIQATGCSLSVNGGVACTEIMVQEPANWPDYVFSKHYKLMSLSELEKNIKNNNHLPGIPSAKEAAENGIGLGEMQKKLLEKIEELTLHLIRQHKEIESMQSEINALKAGHK